MSSIDVGRCAGIAAAEPAPVSAADSRRKGRGLRPTLLVVAWPILGSVRWLEALFSVAYLATFLVLVALAVRALRQDLAKALVCGLGAVLFIPGLCLLATGLLARG